MNEIFRLIVNEKFFKCHNWSEYQITREWKLGLMLIRNLKIGYLRTLLFNLFIFVIVILFQTEWMKRIKLKIKFKTIFWVENTKGCNAIILWFSKNC
jgi:hypothetical protein